MVKDYRRLKIPPPKKSKWGNKNGKKHKAKHNKKTDESRKHVTMNNKQVIKPENPIPFYKSSKIPDESQTNHFLLEYLNDFLTNSVHHSFCLKDDEYV